MQIVNCGRLFFPLYFLKQVFMGVVSTLLDTGKDQVKAKNKTKEKEVQLKLKILVINKKLFTTYEIGRRNLSM